MTDAERTQRTVELLQRPTTTVTRPVWIGCDGWLRMGRGDMAKMLEDMKIATRA